MAIRTRTHAMGQSTGMWRVCGWRIIVGYVNGSHKQTVGRHGETMAKATIRGMKEDELNQLSRETDMAEPAGGRNLAAEITMLRHEVRRLRNALPAPPLIEEPSTEDWVERLPRHPAEQYVLRSLAEISRLVIHHSAVPAEIGPEQIARFQVERRGWPGIGYHYYLTSNGTILKTNPLETISYHTRQGSDSGVGICLAGRFDAAPPTEAQLHAAAHLCAHLCGRFGLQAPLGGVLGHGELTHTECPGGQWSDGIRWRDMLLERIAGIQETARRRQSRVIGHYLLFWQDADGWDAAAWDAAKRYIARHRPVCGFSLETASQAEYVTIVGDEERFPPAVETLLRDAGCIAERITQEDPQRLKELFDQLAEDGRRFRSLEL